MSSAFDEALLTSSADCYTEILARRLLSPVMYWNSHHDAPLEDNIYCVPASYEDPILYAAEERAMVVDRYGGNGIGSAGGSGRCGSFGGLQTKGVGVTPLVSPDADSYHSSGTMVVEEAAQETIMSEVFRFALPFGAVPVIGFAGTGGTFSEAAAYGEVHVRRRVVLIRPFALRPAHFMRNVYHAGSNTYYAGQEYSLDTRRVRHLIPALDDALCRSGVADTVDGKLSDHLLRLADRFAAQAAASFAKRLLHGGITASNIGLDGRFIDFGTACHVNAYRRLARPPGMQDLWNQAGGLEFVLVSLAEHCTQYLGEKCVPSDVKESLVSRYRRQFRSRIEIEFAKMVGLDEQTALACPANILKNFYELLREIWERGARTPFVSYRPDTRNSPSDCKISSTGRYNLNAILAILPNSDVSVGDQLEAELSDSNLRENILFTIRDLKSWVSSQYESYATDLIETYLSMQAYRKNSSMTFLTREYLSSALIPLETSDPHLITSFIDETISRAKFVLHDLHPNLSGDSFSSQLDHLMAIN